MRILKVSSSLPKFKTVTFEQGFNVIVAERELESGEKKSRNGRGKTTLIEIIDFCLGADPVKGSTLAKNALNDVTFTILLVINQQELLVSRNTAYKNKIGVKTDAWPWPDTPLDSVEGETFISSNEWKLLLGKQSFGLSINKTDQIPALSFRGLISYFVRHGEGAYNSPFEHFGKQKNLEVQLLNAFLLDLYWDAVRRLQLLRKEKDALEVLSNSISDGFLESLGGSLGELEAERVILARKVSRTETEIMKFEVLPEYREIENSADKITRNLHELENRIFLTKQRIQQYLQNLNEEAEVSTSAVADIYRQAGLHFPDAVTRRLDDVKAFHRQLILNRKQFLATEISTLKNRLESAIGEQSELERTRSKLISLLSTHRALDEHSKLVGRLSEEKARLQWLEARIDDIKKVTNSKSAIKSKREAIITELRNDYEDRERIRTKAIELFNANTEALYETAGSLIIDIYENGYRFDVDIPRVGSQGVDNMKIFCYDLTLAELWSSKPHHPGILVHDSLILDGVDERQKASAWKLAVEQSSRLDYQYICTINSDQIPLRDLGDEFNLDSYVRLRLSDLDEEGGLLGINF